MAVEPSAPRPLRRDAERNRQRILAAAGEVFAQDGLGVTLDDIARHAGVGVGTVYRRFPDKDALIDALFQERIAAVVQLAETAQQHEDAWAGLCWFLEANIALQASDRGLKELMLGSQRGLERVRAAREQIKPRAEALIRRAQAAGQLRADVASEDVALVQIMVSGVIDSAHSVAPDLWRRCLALVLDGLREGERPGLPGRPPDPDEFDQIMRCWRPPER